jgi:hypothetical protein
MGCLVPTHSGHLSPDIVDIYTPPAYMFHDIVDTFLGVRFFFLEGSFPMSRDIVDTGVHEDG